MKALGVGLGGVRFADVEVVRAGSARPGSRSPGWPPTGPGARRQLMALSLTHTGALAMAVVVAD